MTEDDVLAFVQRSVPSVWALELLILLRRDKLKLWRSEDLVRELRSSDAAIGQALNGLRSGGYVSLEPGDLYRYHPRSPDIDRMAQAIEAVYAEKPLAVVKAIMRAPNDKLRIFADAFKLKD